MKAGIVLDNWKLPIFRKRLTEAGYEYEDGGGLTSDTNVLIVETDDVLALKKSLNHVRQKARNQGNIDDYQT